METATKQVISQHAFLDEDTCKAMSDKVCSFKSEWQRTVDDEMDVFFLGTSSFVSAHPKFDKNFESFQKEIAKTNPFLKTNFGDFYEKLKERLSVILNGPVRFHEKLSYPGFIIWLGEKEDKNRYYPVHYDSQYRVIPWHELYQTSEIQDVITITLPIHLPSGGGRLRTWGPLDAQAMKQSFFESLEVVIKSRECTTHHYQLGHFLIQHGLVIHQPAPTGDFREGEMRMTVQFHGIKINDSWTLYW